MTLHDHDAFRRAHRVSEAAARRGFDWPNAEGPLAKLEEELEELRVAHAEGDPERTSAELGDLLFAAVNLARHLGQDSGACLLATVARFEARWAYVQAELADAGRAVEGASLDELEAAWSRAKRALG